MKELKLTDEQIEQAAKAIYHVMYRDGQWFDSAPITKETCREYARAAEPYLHAPWELPTTNEIDDALAEFRRAKTLNNSRESFKRALQAFIGIRNAALLPKPVDPRREKIEQRLGTKYSALLNNNPTLIEDFLAAMEEK